MFVGIDNNNVTDEFLDIYMEGETEAWLAVGFSDTRNMVSVQSCRDARESLHARLIKFMPLQSVSVNGS